MLAGTLSYNTAQEAETQMNVEIYLEEIGDIQDHIERGPLWDTVELVETRRINLIASPILTLEQAAELGRRKSHKML